MVSRVADYTNEEPITGDVREVSKKQGIIGVVLPGSGKNLVHFHQDFYKVWVIGVLTSQVQSITNQYCGGDFDGSIDLKTSHSSWLLSDGSAIVADDYGTQSSMGCLAPEHNTKPEFKAERVRFGADFIFCSRAYSLDVMKAAALEIAFQWDFELCPVVDSSWGARLDWNSKLKDQGTGFYTYDILVNRLLEGKE